MLFSSLTGYFRDELYHIIICSVNDFLIHSITLINFNFEFHNFTIVLNLRLSSYLIINLFLCWRELLLEIYSIYLFVVQLDCFGAVGFLTGMLMGMFLDPFIFDLDLGLQTDFNFRLGKNSNFGLGKASKFTLGT